MAAVTSRGVLGRLVLPVIQAPMFLVSGPELVLASCNSGVVGTFPALNQRTTEGYDEWLTDIKASLKASTSPTKTEMFGVNLIVHASNPRLRADLEVTVKHKVPLVITSLGAVEELVEQVHSYGGLVFHDVTTIRHARKAAKAGVDGLILVCAGAGGHAGTLSPFALLPEVRRFFDKTIILSGCMSDGQSIAAAIALGADYAYLGTRFINTEEANADPGYKNMICTTTAKDILYTSKISGVPANFLKPSLKLGNQDPDSLPDKDIDFGKELDAGKAWKDIWSAGQGVGTIDDVLPVAELVERLKREFDETIGQLPGRINDVTSRL